MYASTAVRMKKRRISWNELILQEKLKLTDIYINSKAKRQAILDGFLRKMKFYVVIEKIFQSKSFRWTRE
jgi:hypothetical protein